jgi:pimeloyl-ACP methyl ester carboxylesterase
MPSCVFAGHMKCHAVTGRAAPGGERPPVTPTLTNPWHWVTSADGVRIGLLTAGSGPGLLLVHGGMGTIQSWQRMWGALTGQRRVTAMDRRGRGSSGDAGNYELSSEYADVAAVAAALAGEQGGPVDVVGHSIGATCVLGAAGLGAPFRRIALYEPPGPQANAGQLARASQRHGGCRPSWPRDLHLPYRDRRLDPQRGGDAAQRPRRAGRAPHRRCDAAARSLGTRRRRPGRRRPPSPAARACSCSSARPARHGRARSRESLPPHSRRQP